MNYRSLGSSGLIVSAVGLGCNSFGNKLGLEQTRAVVHAALDAGITLFDTADVYGNRGGSETQLGELLRGKRHEVVLATKFGLDMGREVLPSWAARGSRQYVRRAIDGSLRRLQTDYIDLYQYHQPDGMTPIDETLSVLNDLIAEGKVRYAGSSNMTSWQIVEADWVARDSRMSRFVSAQNRFSLLDRSAGSEIGVACEKYGIGFLPWQPLAEGLLTGKYEAGAAPPPESRLSRHPNRLEGAPFDEIERIRSFARDIRREAVQVAIGWLLSHSWVSSVIAGATTAEQVGLNARACEWVPTDSDLKALEPVAHAPD